MLRENEAKCYDATIRYFEAKFAQNRSGVRFPEDNPDTPDHLKIDLLFSLGEAIFAIEHTRIEPYVDFYRGGNLHKGLEDTIRKELASDDLHFLDIMIPNTWHRGLSRGKDRKEFALSVSDLILQSRGHFPHWKEDPETKWHLIGKVEDSEIEVQFRGPDLDFGGPTITYLATHDKNERVLRLEKAIATKLPKLQYYSENGCETVLVLENNDISLTNWWTVWEMLRGLEINLISQVDYLFYISACHSSWYLHPLIEEGKDSSRTEVGLSRFTKFSEADLSSVLG